MYRKNCMNFKDESNFEFTLMLVTLKLDQLENHGNLQ